MRSMLCGPPRCSPCSAPSMRPLCTAGRKPIIHKAQYTCMRLKRASKAAICRAAPRAYMALPSCTGLLHRMACAGMAEAAQGPAWHDCGARPSVLLRWQEGQRVAQERALHAQQRRQCV